MFEAPELMLFLPTLGVIGILVAILYRYRLPIGRALGMIARENSRTQQDFVQAFKEGLEDEEAKSKENHTS